MNRIYIHIGAILALDEIVQQHCTKLNLKAGNRLSVPAEGYVIDFEEGLAYPTGMTFQSAAMNDPHRKYDNTSIPAFLKIEENPAKPKYTVAFGLALIDESGEDQSENRPITIEDLREHPVTLEQLDQAYQIARRVIVEGQQARAAA